MSGKVGKKAIITGASTGIGRALAVLMAREGFQVGLLARNSQLLETLALEIRAEGGTAYWARGDVKDRENALASMKSLMEELGGIDLLIANAGLGAPTLIDPFNVADQEAMIRVNLLGVIYSIEAVLPAMVNQGHGQIAAVSSLAGFKGLPGESGYTASKSGLNTFMEGLRIQLRPKNIKVNTICPGFVKTPMTAVNDFKMPWVMEADEAARRILKGIQRNVKVLRFPWQTSLLMRLISWLPDWVVEKVMRDYNQNPPMPKSPLT
ncbi:MAG: SDR family NAD(P)-dependent oxidoreductase [Gemmataceae bacterium]|nr:SDR family NAD(P)-dependent oxidoreductase [Gemmataceae bacterium]